ncbi:type III secretion system export apparatus subunit SctV [Roseateles sp. SL47]|uniref:type III secretion system export apparatus subunit SctV n=1 Tax=Roseateles sp. SL47 TaxID=2995138 RepID=UPI00226EEACA|nr:type III secretion system export apparatus subunit SctV [Roseateles sp. SL47]WAC74574.1 type III secretion system export apparatus subunit SctV [Roseateles sp. SL47]
MNPTAVSRSASSVAARPSAGALMMAVLQKVPSRVEAILALAVVGVIFLLVLPVPAPVMDVLIAINLFISALLISLALYVSSLTAFSTFPVVLLLSTLFRLGISVATTRLILLDGHAGSIVDTFGNFVVRGDVIVGLVIFTIVTVVQFLVVTKGAERVAEVSARFCLDAMPAKQLAIENELRSNLIDQAEAKRQRNLLNTESQLLGAMDGAMKFVKGDAIAGMVIFVINLVGGLATGILVHGLSAKEAIAHYSVQSVGDGLVAQIPALLTCLTAAILVTRVDAVGKPSDKNGPARSFGRDLLGQLGAYPRALWGLSAVMLLFALIPGMPPLVFGLLAAGAAGLALMTQRQARREADSKAADVGKGEVADAAIVHEFTQMEPLLIVLPDGVQDLPQVRALCAEINEARNELVRGLGMSLPGFAFQYDPTMAKEALELRVYEVPVMRMPMKPTRVAITGRHAPQAAPLSQEVEEGAGPAGTAIVWLEPEQLAGREDLQQVAMSWSNCLRDRVKRKLMRYGPRFTGVQTAQKYMTWMEGWMPELAKELQKSLTTGKLADITQRLLREGVSIRNMRLIMETLSDVGQREREPALLAEFVRHALREQICHELAPRGKLAVFVLDPELEDLLTQSIRQGAAGSFLALSPFESSRIVDAIRETLAQHQDRNSPPVIACAQDVRRFLRTLLEPDLPDVVVLSVGELSPEVAVTVRGTVERPKDMG